MYTVATKGTEIGTSFKLIRNGRCTVRNNEKEKLRKKGYEGQKRSGRHEPNRQQLRQITTD